MCERLLEIGWAKREKSEGARDRNRGLKRKHGRRGVGSVSQTLGEGGRG